MSVQKRIYNTCKRCGEKFLTRKKINGKIRRFYARKYCLKCVPFNGYINQYKDKKPSTRICKNCGKEFKSLVIINGKKIELYLRKNCLKCVSLGESAQKCFSRDGEKVKCEVCNKTYIYKRGTHNCNTFRCCSCKNIERQRKAKIKCVEYKGGKCINCGFNKYMSALVFHHVNPKNKEFRIAKWRIISWNRIKKELNKCILLCANCHAGIHAGHIKLKR
ncbi:hypothetical protein LCGC14_1646980 [marine sediment metagenome]|uniref:HNH domain-containing protein n=1 Tax=marine sediment metagenome TaxID=412755 RepID=A0A0F9HXX7_9ZZZZ